MPLSGLVLCMHTQLCVCIVKPCARILDDAYASFSINLKNHIAEDRNFHATWFYFIGNPHHTTSTLPWILDKSTLKPKRAYIYTKWCRSPRSKTHGDIISSTHGSSPWYIISFSAHEPSSWVSSWEFWKLWFGGQRSMFNKVSAVQNW